MGSCGFWKKLTVRLFLKTIPVFSKPVDLYGKKLFYLLGMGFFAVGTLYGGLAPNMENMVVARVIQGLGSVITKQLGWHWIFYITLVLVLFAILAELWQHC